MANPLETTRVLVIPVETLIHRIEMLIAERIGVVASILNIQPLMQMLMEYTFYGPAFASKESVVTCITAYRIPTIPANELIDSIAKSVTDLIRSIDAGGCLTTMYDFELDMGGNLYIYASETNPRAAPQYVVESAEQIAESIANGDYVPERLRREHNL